MKSLLAWFAGNPVAANLLMFLILVGGLSSLSSIDKEVVPRFRPGEVEITVTYPGAGPAEVEEAVCIPIEEAIHDLPGIKRLNTEAREEQCQIMVLVQQDYNTNDLMSALRTRTQAIPHLPKATEPIKVQESVEAWDAINVMLYGPTDRLTLKRLGQRVRENLLNIPGVIRLEDHTEVPYEIAIQVSAQRLRQYRLTLQEVAEAVRHASLDLSGGVVKSPIGELPLRAEEKARDGKAIAELVLRTNPNGTGLRLGDVATIVDGLAEQRFEQRFDGQPTQGWVVYADRDVVEVARRVKAYVAETAPHLPESIKLITWQDYSVAFEERLQTLLEDGLAGFVLVCIVLTAFLRLRVAFWAGFGILISILGAIWWMPAFGLSLNMLSFFGFLLATGILVDDAIIIGEHIHTRQIQGLPGLVGTIQGVQEVAAPVVLAVLIEIVAFLPGLFLPDWAGQMMWPICMIMILALVFALVEALLILPTHLAVAPSQPPTSRLERLRTHLNHGLDFFVTRFYQPFLTRVLEWRYLALAGLVAFILAVSALVAAGRVPLTFELNVTYDTFSVHLSLPPGVSFTETRTLAQRVEQALLDLGAELERTLSSKTGPIFHIESAIEQQEVDFWIGLSPEARKRLQIDDLVREWRKRIGNIGSAKIQFFTGQEKNISDYDIELELRAPDPALLKAAGEALKQRLAAYPAVYDVSDSDKHNKTELRLTLKPEAKRFGLRLKDLAEQVRGGFHGEEARRVQRGREEIRVMVRYPLLERESLDDLLAMPVRLPEGGEAPLGALAEVSFAPGQASLMRQDRQRILRVMARVDTRQADVNAIYVDLENGGLESLERRFPILHIESGQEEQKAMGGALVHNTLIALVVIYALIAIPFRSYLQPFIFMLSIPMAWTGAILAHLLLGLPLSMESLVGLVAVSGVVVNDSLVLLDYIQKHRGAGENLQNLIRLACAARFRPILLTFLTNFVGFLPILFETSTQARFLIPMVLSLASGLLFGMVGTLVLTPTCYAILDDIKHFARRHLESGVIQGKRI